MDNFNLKKNSYVERIAEYILKNGISKSSLKKMASAALTSDRMLMHYFKDKEEILSLALIHISHDFIRLLDSNPEFRLTFDEFLPFINQAIKDPGLSPYLNIWLELIYLASDEKNPYFEVSKKIGESYWEWLLKVYKPSPNEDKSKMSALIYALTEGFVFLDKIGMTDKIEMALEAILHIYKNKKN